MEYCDYPLHAWSRYRHILRRQCPRKAVLHCREARLGAEEYASTAHRLIHDLRRRITVEQYIDRIFDEELRYWFYRSFTEDDSYAVPDIKQLNLRLNSRFDRDIERIFSGISSGDHKFYIFRELEAQTVNISALAARAQKRIDLYCHALQAELWKLLLETPQLCRREIASPLAIQINELRCYCAPLWALERNGILWIIENNCDDTSALLHKFYAVNTLGREPHLVRSFGYRRDSGEFYECGINLNVSEILRRISEDGAKWEELIAFDLENIPVNHEHCPDCQYDFFCNKYKNQQKGVEYE